MMHCFVSKNTLKAFLFLSLTGQLYSLSSFLSFISLFSSLFNFCCLCSIKFIWDEHRKSCSTRNTTKGIYFTNKCIYFLLLLFFTKNNDDREEEEEEKFFSSWSSSCIFTSEMLIDLFPLIYMVMHFVSVSFEWPFLLYFFFHFLFTFFSSSSSSSFLTHRLSLLEQIYSPSYYYDYGGHEMYLLLMLFDLVLNNCLNKRIN